MPSIMATGGKSAARQQLLALEARRHQIEAEIVQLAKELNSPTESGGPPPGVRGSLLDAEGFPRGDVDHYVVRHQRKILNTLKTDLVEIMRNIESSLLLVMAAKPANAESAAAGPATSLSPPRSAPWRNMLHMADAVEGTLVTGAAGAGVSAEGNVGARERTDEALAAAADDQAQQQQQRVGGEHSTASTSATQGSGLHPFARTPLVVEAAPLLLPFAVVNDVALGGPAQQAGLRVGDKLAVFGAATISNHDGLRKVAEEAQLHENASLRLTILRADHVVELELHPQVWAGRGLIGCHILPV